MKYIIQEYNQEEKFRYNAGSKARMDAECILRETGAAPLPISVPYAEKRMKANPVQSLYYHYRIEKDWEKTLKRAGAGDTVFFQFPVKAHTMLLDRALINAQKNGVRTVALVHDLETLRNVFYSETSRSTGLRLKREEISALKTFTAVIAHNERMKEYLTEKLGLEEKRVVLLEIFDYLTPDLKLQRDGKDRFAVNIAGNMDPDKSGYIYKLPSGVRFELYGADYRGKETEDIRYRGRFAPDELPGKLQGGYGLVWDGTETDRCGGVFGEYLKYNNPHKTSLYLAAGIPVIVWDQAAMAGFIRREGCGMTISSLNEIEEKLNKTSEENYLRMKLRAEAIGSRLREGYYLRTAVEKCLRL